MVYNDYQKIDSGQKHPEYWKYHERRLLEEVKELSLIEDFRHRQPMMKVQRRGRDGKKRLVEVPELQRLIPYRDRWWIADTLCSLYTPEEFKKLKGFRIKHPNDETNTFKPVGDGQSFCSHLDIFCKRIGRVIALERAIWDYLKCPECEVEYLEKGHTGGHMFFTDVKGKVLIKKKVED